MMKKELKEEERLKYLAWMEMIDDKDNEEEQRGLETGLRDKHMTKIGPPASLEVEGFLLDVQRTLLE